MNGTYYQNPTFPGANNDTSFNNNNNSNMITPPGNVSYEAYLDTEQSYIENILRLNKGKKVRAYVSYPDSVEWKDKIYDGIVEEAGRDHLIISDPSTGKWYLIRLIYLNYVEFDENITYIQPYSNRNI